MILNPLVKITPLIALFIVASFSNSFGQKEREHTIALPYRPKVLEKRPIRVLFDGGQSKSMEFYDTINNKLIKSFDFVKESPYNKFPFEVISRDAIGFAYYKIPEAEISNRREYWIGNTRDTSIRENLIPMYLTSTYSANNGIDQDYSVVGYTLTTFSDHNVAIGWHTTCFVFNGNGNIVSTFEHMSIGPPGYLAVSNDGKYLFISSYQVEGVVSPGDEGEPGIPIVEIYNTVTKEKLYRDQMEEWPESPVPTVVDKNKFMIECDLYEKGYKFLILDVENLSYYLKVFDKEKINSLYKVDRNGIFFKNRDGILLLERYETFTKGKMTKK